VISTVAEPLVVVVTGAEDDSEVGAAEEELVTAGVVVVGRGWPAGGFTGVGACGGWGAGW
jgi:hypothetical protein